MSRDKDRTYAPGASLPENRISFTVQNSEGEEVTFELPRRNYLNRGQVKKIDAWGAKNQGMSTADLFIQIVKLFDTDAAKFLDGDDMEVQQVVAMWADYESNAEDEAEPDMSKSEASASS